MEFFNICVLFMSACLAFVGLLCCAGISFDNSKDKPDSLGAALFFPLIVICSFYAGRWALINLGWLDESIRLPNFWLSLVVGIAGVSLFSLKMLYNYLIAKRESIASSLASLENMYQKRFDLLASLANEMENYKQHEHQLFEAVADSRKGYLNAEQLGDKMKQLEKLELALPHIFAISESYPGLKLSELSSKLMNNVRSLESDLLAAKSLYNTKVRQFNDCISSFPNNMAARFMGFKRYDYIGSKRGAEVLRVMSESKTLSDTPFLSKNS